MNGFQRIAVIVFFTAALSFAQAEKDAVPAEQTEWTVCADVQMVSIKPQAALKLLPELVERKTVDAAFVRLQEMIVSGEAELLAWPRVCVRSGVRGVAESFEELISPTDQPPPGGTPGPIAQSNNHINEFGSFEIRNLGPSLDIEPVVSADGRSISINIHAEFVRLIAMKEFRHREYSWAMKWLIHRPDFASSGVTTTLDVANGPRVLLGSFVVSSPQPRVELFILHATATATARKITPPSTHETPPLPVCCFLRAPTVLHKTPERGCQP